MKLKAFTFTAAVAAIMLSGCGVAKTTGKVAAAPFKAAYKTGELAGKGVYYTGKGVYKAGEFTGKAAYQTGKTVYYVGRVPVQFADGVLDRTAKVLSITTQVVDLTGKIGTYTYQIQAAKLDSELSKIKTAKNVMKVFVDVIK
jgi:hypothetical protein